MDLNPIDNILDGIGSVVGGVSRTASDAVLEAVIKFMFGVVADAVSAVTNALIAAITDTTTVDLHGGWFASAGQRRLVALVLAMSAALILGFLLLTIVRSIIAGEPGQMIRAALVGVPLAVFASFAVLAVTGVLLAVTDAASAAVLGDVGANLGQFSAILGVADVLRGSGLLGLVFGLLFVAAAIVVWMQLLLRTALLYLVVTFAPLGFAARVYPGGRQVARRTIEIGVALIVSKFAMALAFAVGATALDNGATASGGAVAVDLRAMLVGTTIMLLAAFMPWLVWRTIPVFEAASVMQGAERAPLRAGMTAASVAVTAASVARLAGASGAAANSTTTAGGASMSNSPTLASQQLLLEQLSAATRPRLDPPVDPAPASGSDAGKRDTL